MKKILLAIILIPAVIALIDVITHDMNEPENAIKEKESKEENKSVNSDNNEGKLDESTIILSCQSERFPKDRAVIVIYSNEYADFIQYSSSGIFDASSRNAEVTTTDYTYLIKSFYYDKVAIDRTELTLSMMRKAPLSNANKDTYEDWKTYPCSLGSKLIAEEALNDLNAFSQNKEINKNEALSQRKI